MRKAAVGTLVVLVGQILGLLCLSQPVLAISPQPPLGIDAYVDSDNNITQFENGQPGDPTYDPNCGGAAGWTKSSKVYGHNNPPDNRVTMILRYRNSGGVSNPGDAFFVIYTPPGAVLLNEGQVANSRCPGNAPTAFGVANDVDRYTGRGGEHVWFEMAAGSIPPGWVGTFYVQYSVAGPNAYSQWFYHYQVSPSYAGDNPGTTAVLTSNYIPVGYVQHSFKGVIFGGQPLMKGLKADITWANPTVHLDPEYNGPSGQVQPFSVEWPMIVNRAPNGAVTSYIQTGWYKDPTLNTTWAFGEYQCLPNVCRQIVNTGMSPSTHTFALEYDGAFNRWCADQDGLLCFLTFSANDTGMSSGNEAQFAGETIATEDQLGGVPATQVYEYNLSFELQGSSNWTKFPIGNQPADAGCNCAGTPYGGNHYWDNNTGSWAFSSFTNALNPQ